MLQASKPVFTAISGTKLKFATNTNSDLFVYSPTGAYYYLSAGRWFSAPGPTGPWTYATDQLPAYFASIPPNSAAGRVLSSVPGTPEAKDAVLLAQIPTTVEIYTIPPNSPVYNVVYVTQQVTPTGSVQASYTAGYLGVFIVGAALGAFTNAPDTPAALPAHLH